MLLVLTLAVPAFAQRLQDYALVETGDGTRVVMPVPAGTYDVTVPPPFTPGLMESHAAPPEPDKIHPAVVEWLGLKPPQEVVRVLVTMRENRAQPKLPPFRRDLSRSAKENLAVLAERRRLLTEFGRQRATDHRARVARLGADAFAHEESFTAANTMRVRTTVGALARLIAADDVVAIEPESGNEPPPQLSPNTQTGRTWMGTDFWAWYAFGLSGNRTESWQRSALLDTGVRATHTLLTGRINMALDCVNGTSNFCQSGSNLNPGDTHNHGTSTAAIMSGTATLGEAYKGVSFHKINSYKVYDNAPGGLNYNAVLRAFAAAQANGDETIVAEMQAVASTNAAITTAAENSALQYGQAVYAATGNGPLPGVTGGNNYLVRSPAIGRNVLAIGAFDATNGSTVIGYSFGPTADGRIKPDILMPSFVYTASNASNTAIRNVGDPFGGTSCATAFGGGLNAVQYNMTHDSPWPYTNINLDNPGWNYVEAILNGDRGWPQFETSARDGVGKPKMPISWCENANGGNAQKVTLSPTVVSAQFSVFENGATGCTASTMIDAAIWWKEQEGQTHQRIQMFLYGPNGTVVDQSTNATSIFQKIRYNNPGGLAPGTYVVRIFAYTTPTRSVEVFHRNRKSTR